MISAPNNSTELLTDVGLAELLRVSVLLTIHDSVLLEVPEHLIDHVRQQVIEVMERPLANFTVPLRVDVRTGRTWAECKHAVEEIADCDELGAD